MKSLTYGICCIVSMFFVCSCSITDGDYKKLELFTDNNIITFKFIIKLKASNINGIEYVQVINLSTKDIIIDNNQHTVIISEVIVPDASETFAESERTKITLQNLIGVATISTGATIKPADGGAPLGVPGDYSRPRKFVVTSADGSTQAWSVEVKMLTK